MNAKKSAGGCGACANCRHCHNPEEGHPENGTHVAQVEGHAEDRRVPLMATLMTRGGGDLTLATVL